VKPTTLELSVCTLCSGKGFFLLNEQHRKFDGEQCECTVCNGIGEVLNAPKNLRVLRNAKIVEDLPKV